MSSPGERLMRLTEEALAHDEETFDKALARYQSWCQALVGLCKTAKTKASKPSLIVLPGTEPDDDSDDTLAKELASLRIIPGGRKVQKSYSASSSSIGVTVGPPASESFVTQIERELGVALPASFREVVLHHQWFCLRGIPEETLVHLPESKKHHLGLVGLNRTARECIDTIGEDAAAFAQRFLFFAGDLEEGWVLDLGRGSDPPVVHFFQDEDFGRSWDEWDLECSSFDAWASHVVDRHIRQTAAALHNPRSQSGIYVPVSTQR